jgi:hypothetical protein
MTFMHGLVTLFLLGLRHRLVGFFLRRFVTCRNLWGGICEWEFVSGNLWEGICEREFVSGNLWVGICEWEFYFEPLRIFFRTCLELFAEIQPVSRFILSIRYHPIPNFSPNFIFRILSINLSLPPHWSQSDFLSPPLCDFLSRLPSARLLAPA